MVNTMARSFQFIVHIVNKGLSYHLTSISITHRIFSYSY